MLSTGKIVAILFLIVLLYWNIKSILMKIEEFRGHGYAPPSCFWCLVTDIYALIGFCIIHFN